jgi:hypothetical protein
MEKNHNQNQQQAQPKNPFGQADTEFGAEQNPNARELTEAQRQAQQEVQQNAEESGNGNV